MSTYKLKYFNIKGRAEVIRFLFALKGQKYEDIRYSMEQWETEKNNVPFGVMPVLEVDGIAYGQSGAIASFLARRFNFYGLGDTQALEVDQVVGIVQDIANTATRAYQEKDEAKKAELMQQNRDDKLPNYFRMLQKLLKRNNTGFFVGDSITLADLVVFDICDKVKGMVDLDAFDEVKKCQDNVSSNPKIKKWLETRPATEY